MSVITDNLPGLVVSLLACFICFVAGRCWSNRKHLKLYLTTKLKLEEPIRISAAYLFRIMVDGRYLLIRGRRIRDQFQPVGGVYQYFDSARSKLNDLHSRPDDSLKSNGSDPDDLRIVIPGKNVVKFLEWFDEGVGREINVTREFREELVESGYIDRSILLDFKPELIRHCERELGYSMHFEMCEVLVHDAYEVVLPEAVQRKLKNYVLENPEGDLVLVGRTDIERGSFERGGFFYNIAPTAKKVL